MVNNEIIPNALFTTCNLCVRVWVYVFVCKGVGVYICMWVLARVRVVSGSV